MRKRITLAVFAATIAVLTSGTAAHASPSAEKTRLLGTYGFGRAQTIGAEGVTSGAWTAFRVRSGFAGDDLIVTYKPRKRAATTETPVYTAAFNEVKNPQAECEKVGADGVKRHVWVSFRCRTGWAPSYTLLVR